MNSNKNSLESNNNDDNSLNELLKILIDREYLKGAALGITKLVISKGVNTLSEKQKDVFQEFVIKKYKRECPFCKKIIVEIDRPLEFGMHTSCANKFIKYLKLQS